MLYIKIKAKQNNIRHSNLRKNIGENLTQKGAGHESHYSFRFDLCTNGGT